MCGIVGYVGSGPASARAEGVVMGGLERLEYRGYDSAGIAVVVPGSPVLAMAKKAGKLANLAKLLAETPLAHGTAAIGHTRWATHGSPTDA
ncbi:MAG: glutamine--fructose-6-phosphate aminotransferase, partial [Demequinaceae bacterium]|nr:glutamine--fructose-6-phosphate aminotransferase [Demequinaceae bacterium]